MSRLAKSAFIAVVIVAAWTLYDWVRFSMAPSAFTGSGGLGAASFGVSEALVELVITTSVIWLVLFVKSRVGQSNMPAPRQ
jgi:hypothetical protein